MPVDDHSHVEFYPEPLICKCHSLLKEHLVFKMTELHSILQHTMYKWVWTVWMWLNPCGIPLLVCVSPSRVVVLLLCKMLLFKRCYCSVGLNCSVLFHLLVLMKVSILCFVVLPFETHLWGACVCCWHISTGKKMTADFFP